MITTILVDDEPKSIKNLTLLLTENCSNVAVIDTANSALDAVRIILEKKPDVVFLDVQMPGYDGFDVLDQIKNTPSIVVFTTAHKEHAINALKNEVFDFLVKPIDIDELKTCVERLAKKIASKPQTEVNEKLMLRLVELNVKDGIIFIKPNDITRIEASGSYSTFYLRNSIKHVVSKGLKEFEFLLENPIFYRCHKSYIINLRDVNKFINHDGLFALMADNTLIEIARKNKEEFLERLKKLNIG